MQKEKCLEKETGRKQVLDKRTTSPGANTDWIKVALQESSKKSAVTTMMKQVYNQHQTKAAKTKGRTTAVTANKKRKAKPTKSTENTTRPPQVPVPKSVQQRPTTAVGTVIHQCGCRHADLSGIKSFTKAEAKYYVRPNKFLKDRSCLDCQLAVTNMECNAPNQRSVVFYCNEGIKGFDAPEDDPMKSALTCDLILCPKCEAKRRIEYNKADSGQQSNGVKRRRQQTRR